MMKPLTIIKDIIRMVTLNEDCKPAPRHERVKVNVRSRPGGRVLGAMLRMKVDSDSCDRVTCVISGEREADDKEKCFAVQLAKADRDPAGQLAVAVRYRAELGFAKGVEDREWITG